MSGSRVAQQVGKTSGHRVFTGPVMRQSSSRVHHRFTQWILKHPFEPREDRRGEMSFVFLFNEQPVSEFTAVKCAAYYRPTRSDEKLSEVFTVS